MKTESTILLERQLNAAEGWLGLGDYQSAESELDLIPEALRTAPRFVFMSAKIRSARALSSQLEFNNPADYIAPSLLALWVQQAYGPQNSVRPPEPVFVQTLG